MGLGGYTSKEQLQSLVITCHSLMNLPIPAHWQHRCSGGGLCQLKHCDASLSSSHRADFLTLNEAFHHAALLQLYSRILSLPSSSPPIQTSVRQIIKLVSSMNFLHKPCPCAAVLLPVFTAGCESCQPAD